MIVTKTPPSVLGIWAPEPVASCSETAHRVVSFAASAPPLSARVVKLVDTGDLKSPGHRGRAGSSPAPGTTLISIKTYIYMFYEARGIDSEPCLTLG